MGGDRRVKTTTEGEKQKPPTTGIKAKTTNPKAHQEEKRNQELGQSVQGAVVKKYQELHVCLKYVNPFMALGTRVEPR